MEVEGRRGGGGEQRWTGKAETQNLRIGGRGGGISWPRAFSRFPPGEATSSWDSRASGMDSLRDTETSRFWEPGRLTQEAHTGSQTGPRDQKSGVPGVLLRHRRNKGTS